MGDPLSPGDDNFLISLEGDDTDFAQMMRRTTSLITECERQISVETKSAVSQVLELGAAAEKGFSVYTQAIERARDAQGRWTKETKEFMDIAKMSQSSLGSANKALAGVSEEARIRTEAEARMAKMFGTLDRMAGAEGIHGAGIAGGGRRIMWLHQMHAGLRDVETIAFRAYLQLHRMGGLPAELSGAALAITSVGRHAAHMATYADLLKTAGLFGGGAAAGAAGAGEAGAAGAAGGTAATASFASVLAAAASGAAVFAATVSGVTYAISGMEGVLRVPGNILEGLKYILYATTFGWLDFTEATKRAKETEMEMASMEANSHGERMRRLQERTDMFRGLNEEVKNLKDHSIDAEKVFADKFIGKLGQLGPMNEESKGSVTSDIARRFEIERVNDFIKKLEEEAKTYKMTRDEVAAYTLALNEATVAQRKQAEVFLSRMRMKDAEEEAKKKAEHDAKEAEAKAKHLEEEAKRARARLVEEGKHFHDAFRTPMEKLQDQAIRARELFRAGVISVDDYATAVKKLEEGAKAPKIKRVEEGAMGVAPAIFGSVEDMAAREAYLRNRQADLAAARVPGRVDAEIRGRGLIPVHRELGGKPLTKEELETRTLLTEMREHLRIIATNTGRKPVVLGAAGLGGRP